LIGSAAWARDKHTESHVAIANAAPTLCVGRQKISRKNTNFFTDGFVLNKLLFKLVSLVEGALSALLHVMHLLLDGRHRVERRQRHTEHILAVSFH